MISVGMMPPKTALNSYDFCGNDAPKNSVKFIWFLWEWCPKKPVQIHMISVGNMDDVWCMMYDDDVCDNDDDDDDDDDYSYRIHV